MQVQSVAVKDSGHTESRTSIAVSVALVVVLVGACTSVEPQVVDLSPILAAESIDPSLEISSAFSDFERSNRTAAASGAGRSSSDEITGLWSREISGSDMSASWQIRISVEVIDSPEGALRELERWCRAAESGFADGEMLDGAERGWRYCLSPIVQLRNDPEGWHLPSRTSYSVVYLQRDRLVIALEESQLGASRTAKDPVIRDLGERLQRLSSRPADKR